MTGEDQAGYTMEGNEGPERASASTLGTDPWVAHDERLRAHNEALERLDALWAKVERLTARLLDAWEERRRLAEVVRRLERRVRELEAELEERRRRATDAARRIAAVEKELRTWQRNAPSP